MPSAEGYPDHDFFNDPFELTQEISNNSNDQNDEGLSNDVSSKLKRTACVLCRKRKLRCDAARPKCATCDRLGHSCEYNEIRKKSGPKRGYVKALEARLSQVETQLKSANGTDQASSTIDNNTRPSAAAFQEDSYQRESPSSMENGGNPFGAMATPPLEANASVPNVEPSWDMISLGLEEPLPEPEIQNELFSIYFRKVAPTAPMIHQGRFYAALKFAPHMRPPVCLRYAMWTMAAGMSDAYSDLQLHFYRRARKYQELDEMKSFGENIMAVAQCQASVLLGTFEFKNMHFPRAWLSTGRAVRLALMLGLQRLDGVGLEVKQCAPPPVDWTETEERRRTFWMVFWADRCASIGTGWPMSLDEQDIMTNLPASEGSFQNSQTEESVSLEQALKGQLNTISAFGSAIMLTALFGRNLLHLHRPTKDEREHDLNGAFWQRHRSIDSTLLSISLNLPEHLRIPNGLPDPNVIFMNMCIHTSVICLHQAAIFKVDRNKLPANLGQESKIRCVSAAAEIASLMRSISHCDLGTLNPFSAFCLYVASRVFVQYLKSRRNDTQILGSLHFMLSAMHALKRKTPLAESFLAQLDVDLEGAGIPTNFLSSVESLRKKGIPQSKHMGSQRAALGVLPVEKAPHGSMDNGMRSQWNANVNSPAEELRALGNRPAPFTPTNPQWKNKTSTVFEQSDTMGGDRSWSVQMNDRSMASLSPQTSVPTSETSGPELHATRSNTTKSNSVATPEAAPYRVEKNWQYDWNFNDSSQNSRQQSVENMDLSPNINGNGSSSGNLTHRSSSSGQTAFTPPRSDTSNDLPQNEQQQAKQQQQSFSLNPGFSSNSTGFDDNQPAGFINFKDYSSSSSYMPGYQVNGATTAPSPMTQEFDNLTKAFLPPTPGGALDEWGANISTGLTPGPGDDWTSMLDDTSTWDAGLPVGKGPWEN